MRISLRQCLVTASCAVLAGSALAGCGTDTGEQAAPAPSSTEQSSSVATSPLALAKALRADETTDPAPQKESSARDTAPKAQNAEGSGSAQLVVSDIRVGEHEGKDRVVFEFSGTGEPGYSVQYVDDPAQQGSGRPLGVSGDSFLEVLMTGQALPTQIDATEVPVGTLDTDEVSGIADVAFGGQFEGRAQSVIGVEGTDRDFTVFTLTNPTRLVVDISR